MDAWNMVHALSNTEDLCQAAKWQRMQIYCPQRKQEQTPQSGTIFSDMPGLLISSVQEFLIMVHEFEIEDSVVVIQRILEIQNIF